MLNTFGRLRTNRDFLVALAGRSVSVFGDEMALVALTLRLQASGARPCAVALLLGAGLVPFVVLARVAGRVADSADSRRVLLAASVAQACCCAPLIVVRNPAVMIALVAALGAGATFSQATWQALTPRVAGEDNIAAATAAQQACFTLASVLAPAASGLLSGALGTGAPLAIDAVSFGAMVVAAATVRARRSPAPADHPERIRGGWSLLRADRLLRPLVTGLAAFVLLAMMLNVVGVFLVRGTLHASATWYGVVEAAWMLGVVTGTLSAGPLSAGMLSPDGRRALAALAGAGLMSLAFVGYGLAPAVTLLAPLAVFGGAGNGLTNVCVSTLVISRTTERARGRVSAALGAVLNGAMVISLAAGGGLAALLPPRAIFLLAGGLGCLAVLLVAARVALALLPFPAGRRSRSLHRAHVEEKAPISNLYSIQWMYGRKDLLRMWQGVRTIEQAPTLSSVPLTRLVFVRDTEAAEVGHVFALPHRGRGFKRPLEGRPHPPQGGLCHALGTRPSKSRQGSLCLRTHPRGGAAPRPPLTPGRVRPPPQRCAG